MVAEIATRRAVARRFPQPLPFFPSSLALPCKFFCGMAAEFVRKIITEIRAEIHAEKLWKSLRTQPENSRCKRALRVQKAADNLWVSGGESVNILSERRGNPAEAKY